MCESRADRELQRMRKGDLSGLIGLVDNFITNKTTVEWKAPDLLFLKPVQHIIFHIELV